MWVTLICQEGQRHTEMTLGGRGLEGSGRKVKGLSKNKQNLTGTAAWWLPEGEGEGGLGRTMVMEGDLAWGGEHTVRYADDG